MTYIVSGPACLPGGPCPCGGQAWRHSVSCGCDDRRPIRRPCGPNVGRRLFRLLYGRRPECTMRVPCTRSVPPVLVQVGELKGLIYRSDRDSPGRPRTYIHFMEDRPLLTSDPDGRQLFVIGGSYRVTGRGIEG